MILTRTPFRFTLGGGGTDLPSYYSKHGGFIFAGAIDKYMFLTVNRPIVDSLVRVKYSSSETVETASQVQHALARASLLLRGIERGIEVISMADIPASSGLGSSSAYAVGLLGALSALNRQAIACESLAEEACRLEIEVLKKPVGKQDAYVAAFGGLPVLEISKAGRVKVRQARIDFPLLDDLCRNTLLFYTGNTRQTEEILRDQDNATKRENPKVIDALHRIKELGYEILEAIEEGNLDDFGHLMHAHWEAKKSLSSKIASPRHHRLYDIARENGALGGKITGAGGGGFFVFYTSDRHTQLRKAMEAEGLRELHYRFDREGSKVLVNL